jgi:hypothetical protein
VLSIDWLVLNPDYRNPMEVEYKVPFVLTASSNLSLKGNHENLLKSNTHTHTHTELHTHHTK